MHTLTESLFAVDWEKVLVPHVSIVEIIVRGTIMYVLLFVLMRIILKRQAGGLGVTDLLVVVLVADAAERGMSGGYDSVTDGVFLVATILAWSHFLNWLGERFPSIEHWIRPQPVKLVERGTLLRKNLQRELITKDELESQMREQGIERLSQVKLAHMESDGKISFVKEEYESEAHGVREGEPH